jgi:hypothetical protein
MTVLSLFKKEAVIGTQTIVGETFYEIGLPVNKSHIISPYPKVDVGVEENNGVFTQTLYAGNTPQDGATLLFCPVNALFWYWMLGKATDHTTYIDVTAMEKTMSPCRKKRNTFYWENLTGNKYYAKGNAAASMQVVWKIKQPLYVQMQFKGMTHGWSAAPTNGGFPGSISSTFNICENVSWDGTSYGCELLEFQLTQNLVGHIAPTGFYSQVDEQGAIAVGFNLILHGDCAILMADLYEQLPKTLIVKMTKPDDTTKYWQLTATARLLKCENLNDIGLPDYWGVAGLCQAPTVKVVDGLTITEYS